MSTEDAIERYFFDGVRKRGGFCIKMAPGREIPKGFPDRLVGLPGLLCVVEMKRPKGGVFSRTQIWWRNLFRRFGLPWYSMKTLAEVDAFLAAWPINKGNGDDERQHRR